MWSLLHPSKTILHSCPPFLPSSANLIRLTPIKFPLLLKGFPSHRLGVRLALCADNRMPWERNRPSLALPPPNLSEQCGARYQHASSCQSTDHSWQCRSSTGLAFMQLRRGDGGRAVNHTIEEKLRRCPSFRKSTVYPPSAHDAATQCRVRDERDTAPTPTL